MIDDYKGKLIYLASPYTHPNPRVMEERFHSVCKAAARLIGQGHFIYCPIAHSHPIAQAANLPSDWQYWEHLDKLLISKTDAMAVLMLPGWDSSKGVYEETRIALNLGLPVFHVRPTPPELANLL